MVFVILLNQFYWVSGAALGGLAGGLLQFNTKGLSFVMTAMFAVIFQEHLKKERQKTTAAVGLVFSLICLLLFGPDSFMIPTMVSILAVLLLLRNKLEKEEI